MASSRRVRTANDSSLSIRRRARLRAARAAGRSASARSIAAQSAGTSRQGTSRPCSSVEGQFARAAHVGGHERGLHRHGFEHGVRCALVLRRLHEQIEGVVQVGDVALGGPGSEQRFATPSCVALFLDRRSSRLPSPTMTSRTSGRRSRSVEPSPRGASRIASVARRGRRRRRRHPCGESPIARRTAVDRVRGPRRNAVGSIAVEDHRHAFRPRTVAHQLLLDVGRHRDDARVAGEQPLVDRVVEPALPTALAGPSVRRRERHDPRAPSQEQSDQVRLVLVRVNQIDLLVPDDARSAAGRSRDRPSGARRLRRSRRRALALGRPGVNVVSRRSRM